MKNTLLLSLIIIVPCISACKKTDKKQAVFPSSIEAVDGKEQAEGYVFNDKNQNNTRDKNEPGFVEQWENDPSLSGQAFPGRDLPAPQPSSHLWTSKVGTDWPAGRHTIEVRVKDMYGRVFTSYHTMRVEKLQQ